MKKIVDCEESETSESGNDPDFETLQKTLSSSSSAARPPEVLANYGEFQATSPGPSHTNLESYFVAMGFCRTIVAKAIKQTGEGDQEAMLETLLAYSAVEESPDFGCLTTKQSESCGDFMNNELTNVDGCDANEETVDNLCGTEKIRLLLGMGYSENQATSAVHRCGPNAQFDELVDSISAAQTANMPSDGHHVELPHCGSDQDESGPSNQRDNKKMKWTKEYNSTDMFENTQTLFQRRKGHHQQSRKSNHGTNISIDDDSMLGSSHIPSHNMTGCGISKVPLVKVQGKFPFFYFESFVGAQGVCERMPDFLCGIEPELIDLQYFSATLGKKRYMHNLPTENRYQLQPLPPLTIQDALPYAKKWWPLWDPRTKFNCQQSYNPSSRVTEKIHTVLAASDGPLSPENQKFVLEECRKWNLVWVGTRKVAPLEPDEIESLLGFPKHHTRGGGVSKTDRYKSLGNTFQVDSMAYHLSVLKSMFPNGITVLSIFSGIGGAEVALHRLGIRLKNVVSIEASEVNRSILRSWWEQTNQEGELMEIGDIQLVNGDKLEMLIGMVGGFDLIIGRSPCNNITGKLSWDGLNGKEPVHFDDYFRILDLVQSIMGTNK